MKKRRALLTGILGALLLLPGVAAAFTNIPVGSDLEKAANFLEIRGGLRARDTFDGDQQMSKVAFLKVLLAPIRLSEEDKKEAANIQLAYTDTVDYHWYAPVLRKAIFLKLIDNTPTAFDPGAHVSRKMALELGLKAYGVPVGYIPTTIHRQFGDVEAGDPFRHVVARAIKYNFLPALLEDMYGVNSTVTKEEVVLMTYRLHMFQSELATQPTPSTTDAGDIPTITVSVGGGNGVEELLDLGHIQEVWNQVEADYLFMDEVDQDELTHGAIKGMIRELGDPYSEYLPPLDAESFRIQLDGEIEGIGSYIDSDPMGVRIESVIPGGPAEKSGLKSGDIIYEVDGERIAGLTTKEASHIIRGPKGTDVELGVIREGLTITVTVTRDTFVVESVFPRQEGGLYIVRIADFRDTTGEEFAALLPEISAMRPRAIVLDLRDNRGGYLSASLQILRHFFAPNEVLLSINYGGEDDENILDYISEEEGALVDYPVVVIVNKNTASAAEILAGTLQDYGKATLIGEQTYGKGTVQAVDEFSDSSTLKITLAKWLTGKGRWVNEWTDEAGETQKGLTPDVVITKDQPQDIKDQLLQFEEEAEAAFEQEAFKQVEQILP